MVECAVREMVGRMMRANNIAMLPATLSQRNVIPTHALCISHLLSLKRCRVHQFLNKSNKGRAHVFFAPGSCSVEFRHCNALEKVRMQKKYNSLLYNLSGSLKLTFSNCAFTRLPCKLIFPNTNINSVLVTIPMRRVSKIITSFSTVTFQYRSLEKKGHASWRRL